MKLEIVTAEAWHAVAIGRNLREADRLELEALDVRPVHAVLESLDRSLRAYSWLVDGVPACMWGLAQYNLSDNFFVPWLLTTPAVDRHWLAFARESRRQLKLFSGKRLEAYVDSRYAKCIRWLYWLGFYVEPAVPVGKAGIPFHKFRMG